MLDGGDCLNDDKYQIMTFEVRSFLLSVQHLPHGIFTGQI